MVYDYTREEIAAQIERLLAYPQVGPLTAEAIAINLGGSLDVIQPVIEESLAAGRISRLDDGRLTCA